MKNILYIRADDLITDSRAQKEIDALLTIPGCHITFLGWNRDCNGKMIEKNQKFSHGEAKVLLFSIYGPWGAGKKNFFALLKFLFSVRKFVINNISNFDAVHIVDLPSAFVLRKVIGKKKKRFIYDIFDYYADLRKYPSVIRRFFISAEKKVIECSDCTIICNEQRIKQIGSAKPKRLVIIHNSPDISDVHVIENKVNGIIKFVYVGNLVEDRLIKLTIHFFEEHPEYELHIGGIGALSNFVEKSSLLHPNIVYYGKMEYSKVLQLENECNVLIALYDPRIPNHHFVAPNKFYEAIALGKQLLMCKGTGLDDYFKKYPIGELIENNEKSYCDAVRRLVDQKERWSSLSNIEWELFEKQFSWEIMSNRLIELYSTLFSSF